MTNFIKKILAAVTLLGVVSVTPVFAGECAKQSFEKLQTDAKAQEEHGIKLIEVPDSALKNFTDKAGEPPETDLSKPYHAYVLRSDDMAMLFIIQDGCVTVSAGPGPLQTILNLLGLNNA